MSNSDVTHDVESWVLHHKIYLMKEDGLDGRFYFYVSSKSGETFQIVIEKEQNHSRRLDAHLIETPTDEEAHFIWEFPSSQTKNALDLALGNAQAWFQRNAR